MLNAAGMSLVATLCATCFCSRAIATTLNEALINVYRSNPDLLAEREQVRALDEAYAQARDAFGPVATLSVGVDHQSAEVDQADFFGGKITVPFTATTPNGDLRVSQVLYSGGRLTAQLDLAAANLRAEREALRSTENNLFLQAITAYTDVLRAGQQVDVLDAALGLLRSEQRAISLKFKAGAATIADQAEIVARVEAGEAQLLNARGDLESANAEYEGVVGFPPTALSQPTNLPGLPLSLEQAERMGLVNSPTLLQQKARSEGAQASVNNARASDNFQVRASVDLNSSPVEPYDVGLNDKSVTFGFTVDIPVDLSRSRASALRQATIEAQSAQLRLASQKRLIVQNVKQLWFALTSNTAALARQQANVAAEELTYSSLHKEYEAGLLSTIDLLNAEQELSSSRVAEAQASQQVQIDQARLLSTLGLLQAQLILPEIKAYSPETEFKRVPNGSAGFPTSALGRELDKMRVSSPLPSSQQSSSFLGHPQE